MPAVEDASESADRRALPFVPIAVSPALGWIRLPFFGTILRAAIQAVVKGNLLVAAIQGALGGLAFWYLGVGAALLWAVPMFIAVWHIYAALPLET